MISFPPRTDSRTSYFVPLSAATFLAVNPFLESHSLPQLVSRALLTYTLSLFALSYVKG